MLCHFPEFKEFFRTHHFDVIAVSETWLTENVSDQQVLLPSFTLYRNDRGRIGGGVAIYVRNTLTSCYLMSSGNLLPKHPEYLFIEAWSPTRRKILVGAVYRPPNTGHLDMLESDLESIIPQYKNIVVLGDFNANLGVDDYKSRELRQFCDGLGLHFVPYQPTHHTSASHTWLDMCMICDPAQVISSNQSSEPFLSGHDLISIKYDYKVPKQPPRKLQYRSWNRIDETILERMCNDVDIFVMDRLDSIDLMNDYLHTSMNNILDNVAPLKSKVMKRQCAPWITNDIKELQRRRGKLYRIFKRTGFAYTEFSNIRKLIKKRIIMEKNKHLEGRVLTKNNSRSLWNDIRDLGLIKTHESNHPLNIDINELNAYLTTRVEMSESGNNLHLNLPDHSTSSPESQFDFTAISSQSVKKAIMRIASNSIGPDGFSIKSYKIMLPHLLHVFTLLFNFSLSTSKFPESWKKSYVVPVPKKRDPTQYSDYRPISILPALSKALERCVYNQILKYVVDNNFIDKFQTAFREGMNTQTTITRLLDDIRFAGDHSKVTIAVFFDFSKAFDSVNHTKLLNKLGDMSFSEASLRWIFSYLDQRSQAVRDNEKGIISSWKTVQSGVPQGSVLGPLLYSLYVSDLGGLLNCKYLFYADDLVIYQTCHVADINDTISELNTIIRTISAWCNDNALKLNAAKTKCVIFGSPHNVNRDQCKSCDNIIVNGSAIEFASSVKYLGVFLDHNLSWNEQINYVCKRSMRVLAQLKMNNEAFSVKIKIKLVTALILPIFDYCAAIYTNITEKQQCKLQRKLNACVRFIFKISRFTHITPYYRRLGWLTLKTRRSFFLSCLLYRAVRLNHHQLFGDELIFLQPMLRRGDVRRDYLRLPTSHLMFHDKSFIVSAIRIWNMLPPSLTSLPTLSDFRSAAFLHFFNLETTN